MLAVKAHFDGKVIVPEEPIKLPKGTPLVIQIQQAQPARNGRKGKKNLLDWIVDNRIDDPALPTDLSLQHDHYLYGTPKKKPAK